MIINSAANRTARIAAAGLALLLAVGCAGLKSAPPGEPPPPGTAPVSTPVVELPPAPVPEPAPAAVPRPAASKATTVKAQTPAAVQPAPTPASVPTPSPAPVAAQQATPPLDLKSLEARLRETRAVGVFTKISLKNQVDDLLNQFRAYHQRQTTTTLAALRQSYNLLMLKVLTLLQDSDPSLARDIVTSREAIWSILADRKKFTESNLMAGAMP